MSVLTSFRSGQAVTPAPDAGRVAAIRNSLDVNDPAELAAFGDRARREVTASVDRLLAEVRTADLLEASTVIGHCRDELALLDPAALEPRRGLAGLFDSRGRRLKRMRDVFRRVEPLLTDLAAELGQRAESLARRSTALDALHEQTRAFILELDAYLAAGRDRLPEASREAPEPEPEPEPAPLPETAEAPADAAGEAGDEPDRPAERGPLPPPLLSPHERLERRLQAMAGVRAAALRQLALVRMAQNADLPAVARLRSAPAAVARWSADWTEGLGLDRRRPRRIRADGGRLAEEKAALETALAAVERSLADARARRAEAAERMERVADAIRRAG